MKQAIPIFVFALLATLSTAQISISVHPGVAYGSGAPSSQDIAAYCDITNNSSIPLSVLWERNVVSAPAGWSTWICDMNYCYLPNANACPESKPNVLNPGQSFEMSVHAGPANVDGQALIVVYFADLEDPQTALDSVVVTLETTTSAVNDVSANSIRIYPNPTTSYFQISNPTDVATVALYNIVGNKMREYNARNMSRFDVADLTEGIYLVRLIDANQKVLKTVRLSKR